MTGAWICSGHGGPVPRTEDRWDISEDAMRADGKKRAYRISLTHLCTECMRQREQQQRPTVNPNQGELL